MLICWKPFNYHCGWPVIPGTWCPGHVPVSCMEPLRPTGTEISRGSLSPCTPPFQVGAPLCAPALPQCSKQGPRCLWSPGQDEAHCAPGHSGARPLRPEVIFRGFIATEAEDPPLESRCMPSSTSQCCVTSVLRHNAASSSARRLPMKAVHTLTAPQEAG